MVPPVPIGRWRLCGAAVLLALLLSLTAAAHARATTPLRGAHMHALWSDVSVAEFDRELDLLRDAGANAVRVDLSWSSLESEGKSAISDWYVEKMDAFLSHAKARGIKVIAVFWASPCWASSAPESLRQGCAGAWWERRVDRYAPFDPADYADAAAWVARRWGRRLAALEIWNEPNVVPGAGDQTLGAPAYGGDQARAYAALLKTAYPRVKAAAPGLTVVGGGLGFADGEFLERLYDLGIHGHFDGLSIHPYNEWRDPDDNWKPEWRRYTFITGVPWIREIMTRHGDGAKNLWLTEFGFSTCHDGGGQCVTEQQQSDYVADSFRIAGDWPFVEAAIVYGLRDKGTNLGDRESQYGLVRRDFSLKRGYEGLKRALGGTDPSRGAPDGRAAPFVGGGPIVVGPGGVASVPVICPAGPHTICAGTIMLDTARAVRVRGRKSRRRLRLGARRFAIARGRRHLVRIRLKRSRRGLVRRRGRLRAVAKVERRRTHTGPARPPTARRRLILHPGRPPRPGFRR